HVRNSPQTYTHAIIAPGIVNNIGNAVARIRRDGGTGRRIKLPHLDIRNDPNRERLPTRPCERFSLKDEGIVIAIRSSDWSISLFLGPRCEYSSSEHPQSAAQKFATVRFPRAHGIPPVVENGFRHSGPNAIWKSTPD